MSQTFYNIIYPLIMTLLITMPIIIIVGFKKNDICLIIYNITLYIILLFNLKYYHNNNLLTIIVSFLISCIYIFIRSNNFIKSILIPFFTFINLSFCDIFIGFLVIALSTSNFNKVKGNLLLDLIINLVILAFETLTSLILKRTLYKNIFSIDNQIDNKEITNKPIRVFLAVDIFIIIFVMLIYIQLSKYIFLSNVSNLNKVYLIFSLLILIILLFTSYTLSKYMKSYVNEKLITHENKYLKQYSDTLENSTMDLRRFKHDYLNIMFTLGDLINNDKIDELKDYYNNELAPASDILTDKNNLISLLKNIKISPLKSLVSSKVISAQTKGINMKIEIFDEISKVNMKTFDLCRIMGILLDNAIEANENCDNKFVHFAIVTTDEATIFIILNACLNNCPPVYKLYENNFSTKGNNRGLGLTTVKQIINSYKNSLINTSIDNNTFKQEIIIYN